MTRPTRSLRRKVTMAVFAAIGLSLLLAAAGLGLYEYQAAQPRMRTSLEVLSETTFATVAAAVDFDLPSAAEETLGRLGAGSFVTGAAVLRPGPAGIVFARYAKPGHPLHFVPRARPDGFYVEGDHALLVSTLVRAGSPVATLQIEGALPAVRRGVAHFGALMAAIFLVMLAAGAVLSRLLQNAITRPILQLAETARAVGVSSDYRLRAEVATTDEIGQLSERFNEMLDGLARRDRTIADAAAVHRAVIEGTGVAVITTDPAGVITNFNPAAERLLGYAESELVGRETPALWHDPAEMRVRAEALSRAQGRTVPPGFEVFVIQARSGESEQREWTFVRKDGGRVPVWLVVSSLRNPAGEVFGFVGLATDLSERKAAETALRESEERFRVLAENPLIGILVHQDGVIRYANPGTLRLCGVEAESQVVGRSLTSFLLPEDHEEFAQRAAQLRQGISPGMTRPFRVVRPDAREIWVRGAPTPIRWNGGSAVQVFIYDVTAQREAELALRAGEERFRRLSEGSPVGIFQQDAAGGLLYANDRWHEMTDWPAGTRPGASGWIDVFHPESRRAVAQAWVEFCADHHRTLRCEARLQDRDGRPRWTHVEIRALRGENGERIGSVGTLADVTLMKLHEEVRRVLLESLSDVSRREFFERLAVETAKLTGAVRIFVGRVAAEKADWISPLVLWVRGRIVPADARPLDGGPSETLLAAGEFTYWPDVRAAFPTRLARYEEWGVRSYAGMPLRAPSGAYRGTIGVMFAQPVAEPEIVRAVLSLLAPRAAMELDRLAADEVLRESEERHRVIVEQTRQMVYDLDIHSGRNLWFGAAAIHAITGYALDEFQQVTFDGWAGLIHPDDRPAALAEFERCLAAGATYDVVYRFRRKDGGYRRVTDLGVFLRNEQGVISRMLGAMSDVTERHAAEEQLRQSERKFATIFEQSPDLILVVRAADGRLIDVNRAFVEQTGWPRDAVLGRTLVEIGFCGDGAACARALAGAAAAGEALAEDFAWQGANRERREGRLSLRRIEVNGEPALNGVLHDTTARRRQERALRSFSEITAGVTGQEFFGAVVRQLCAELGVRYALIGELNEAEAGPRRVRTLAAWGDLKPIAMTYELEHTPCEMVTAAGLCHYPERLTEQFPRDPLLVQLGLQSYAGVPIRDHTGRTLGLIAVMDDKPMPDVSAAALLLVLSATRAAAEIQRVHAAAEILRLNADLERRVELRTAELAHRVAEVERLNGEQRALVESLQTSQQNADRVAARLQEVNANLLAANLELEAFSYTVSHDLRAPLRNITGFMELLGKRVAGTLDAESERFVSVVGGEARRMGALIDDLLTFSRIGRTEMSIQPVPLAELVNEVRSELEVDLRGRTIDWQVAALPIVVGDRTLVRQVLANLLANAVKFTRRRPDAVIEVGFRGPPPGGDSVTIFVRDNGAGFNPKYIDKLFGVFQRLHNARDFEGTGIGLANVKRIITRHGGRVWAEGAPDRGAVFYFTLKRAETG